MRQKKTAVLYKLQCVFESQQKLLCDHFVKGNEMNGLCFEDIIFSSTDFLAINYVITTTEHVISKLAFRNCSLDSECANHFVENLTDDHLTISNILVIINGIALFQNLNHLIFSYRNLVV